MNSATSSGVTDGPPQDGIDPCYTTVSPRSPVRTRMASSTGMTKILPSPMLPVRAALLMISTTWAASWSFTTTSIFSLGSMSTVYVSPPRPPWTMPFWAPRPVTWTMFRPTKPPFSRASFTSFSFSGRMIASIFFMLSPLLGSSARWGGCCRCLAWTRGRGVHHRRRPLGQRERPRLLDHVRALAVLGYVEADGLFVVLHAQPHRHVEYLQDDHRHDEGVAPDP